MGMGFEGAYGGLGAMDALDKLLAQRMAERKYADLMRQQNFENQLNSRKLDQQDTLTRLKIQELADAAHERAAAAAGAEQDRRANAATAVREQIPPGFQPDSPDLQNTVGMLRSAGRGWGITNQEARPSVDVGPLRPGDTGAARPQGFLFSPTQKQADTEIDNQRLATEAAAKSDEANWRLGIQQQLADLKGAQPDRSGEARTDRSYQYHRAALDKLAKPLEDQQARLGRLIETVNQGTPQADALVAPEMLTVMAGGQGSGLRMNEAEIARIIGGRSNWESLKATLNQWKTDPMKAQSITPAQRQQIRALIGAVHQKSQAAIGAINEGGDRLIDAPDALTHRQVLMDTRRRLQQIYEGPAESAGAPQKPTAADLIKKYGGR